jgi:hypothetical protein
LNAAHLRPACLDRRHHWGMLARRTLRPLEPVAIAVLLLLEMDTE